jgi:hypothetical protein
MSTLAFKDNNDTCINDYSKTYILQIGPLCSGAEYIVPMLCDNTEVLGCSPDVTKLLD